LVASKCTLASRVDAFHESQDGKIGDNLLSEIQTKLDKLQEPPPVKTIKPLPAPIDAPRKKRGGRRWVFSSIIEQKLTIYRTKFTRKKIQQFLRKLLFYFGL
jgi:RNA processing factor Prp31